MTLKTRTAERTQYLAYLLDTALFHSGYGFPLIHSASLPDDRPADHVAIIGNVYEDDSSERYTVTPDTMARGLGIIRRAIPVTDGTDPREASWYANADTLERLGIGETQRADILSADRDNEAADLDVVDTLAILECALFGSVVYG